MASVAPQSQPNGVPTSSAGPSQSQTQPTQSSLTVSASQATTAGAAASSGPADPSTSAPRPRDARTIELLLTSQGVTSYDQRVPLLLLDFAYRHTSSILSDALHLASDPYTTQAGAKPSAASGVAPSAPSNIDASVSANAINIAIASRQAYQFRGGSGAGGAGGGGASKDWLLELAKERNKVQLPRVMAHEWGVRLPNERFVLSGMGWGLRDTWAEGSSDDDDDDEEQMEDVMEGVELVKKESDTKDGGETGGLDELLGDDMEGDEDMEGME
ncbi:putative Transcription initiation factor IID, 31kD subunit-domain-containing protein [Seiridium unicorne]|uniref:Transcription initiation factor IID, 31kD subunit-domain-containing protein n=1 Tax=Seiridium unicorne TaxID=138068 RepID=A0ABR2VF90_9PEZI